MTLDERIQAFDNTPLTVEIGESGRQWLIDNGFFTAPASTKYHGNYPGGLFDHSFEVMNALVDLTEKHNLVWGRKVSPYLIGMLHDLCKIDQYKSALTIEGVPVKYEFNDKTLLKGHGDKSVMLISTLTHLTEEEMLCIRYHMGAFVEKEEWNDYTGAIHKYPNVLWTHTADMIAAHILMT